MIGNFFCLKRTMFQQFYLYSFGLQICYVVMFIIFDSYFCVFVSITLDDNVCSECLSG